MSSHPHYDRTGQYAAANEALNPAPDPLLWNGTDTPTSTSPSGLSNSPGTEVPLAPKPLVIDEQQNIHAGFQKSIPPQSIPNQSINRKDDARKTYRGESRPRRTYACGPCKRYKMKCNLETPCQSCVTSKRVEDCLNNPANPPLEEERSKIERRRRRNSRKKDLDHRARAPKQWEQNSNASPAANHASHELHLLAASELLPAAVKSLSPMGRDFVFNLNVPLATDFVAPPPCHVRRMQNYKFMKEYAVACQQQTVKLLHETAVELALLLENVNYNACAAYFQKYASMDSEGVQYLVDIKDYFNVAHNLIIKGPQIAQAADGAVFDGLSMRGLSLTAVVFACKELFEGHFERAQRWLAVLQQLLTALGEPETLEDMLHRGTWVVMMKFPLTLSGHFTQLLHITENYMLLVANLHDFLQYLCFKKQGAGRPIPAAELYALTDALSESFKNRGLHDRFLAVARVWIFLRFSEVEINVISLSGPLQLRYLLQHSTIQPNRQLLQLAFGESLGKLTDNWSFFQLVLCISGQFFGRFESFSSPTDIIYSYLTLYNELHLMLEPTQAALYAELPLMPPVAYIEKFCETICVLIMRHYLNVRWLTITKVERPHFPSLRFAHYVSNLMVLHRLMQVLDGRLAAGGAGPDVDPAYIDDNLQVNVYLVLFHTSKNLLVFQVLYNVASQALFLAVLSQLLTSSPGHIDLRYIFDRVHALLLFARTKLECISFLRGMPALAQLISFFQFFHDFAMRPAVISLSLAEFVLHISALMTPAAWSTFGTMCYGSAAKTEDYIARLWDFFSYLGKTSGPLKVLNHLFIDTGFFRTYENAFEPFNYPVQLVDDYMRDVVGEAA